MSQELLHDQGRAPPPKLLAWTVTGLAVAVAWQCYAPQYGLLQWGLQSNLDELCASKPGCISAMHRSMAAADRRSVMSSITVSVSQRWKPIEVERFKREFSIANGRREVEVILVEELASQTGQPGQPAKASGGSR